MLMVMIAAKALILFVIFPYLMSASPQTYNAANFPDDYEKIAWNLAQGNGYRIYPETSETMLRTPGFVLLLAGIFSIFGKSLFAVQTIHILFSTLTALVTGLLARESGLSRRAAGMAALIFFFFPGTIVAESRGGLESMLTLSLAVTVYLAWMAVKSGRYTLFAWAGVMNAVTLLIKSSAAPALLAIYAFAWFREKNWAARKRIFSGLVVSCLITVVLMLPWVWRNYQISGAFIPTMTVSGLAMFQGEQVVKNLQTNKDNYVLLDEAAAKQIEIAHALNLRVREAFFPQFYSVRDEVMYYRTLGEHAVEAYSSDPGLLVRAVIHNSWAFWLQGRTAKATMLNAALTLPLLILAVAGMLMGRKLGIQVWPFVWIIIAFMLPHLVILAMARYYIPVVPFLAILCSIPIARASRRYFSTSA